MAVVFSNNAKTTLASTVSTSATNITVADGSVFPALNGADYTYVTLEDGSGNVEIVKVTALSSNALTVVRAQDNTSARAFSSGDKCELRLTAAGLNEVASQADTDTNTTYSVGDGGLTQINFTSADNTKLDGIATNANNYTLPFTDNSSNWNTAYGWGNHASAGYVSTTGNQNIDGIKIFTGVNVTLDNPVNAWKYIRLQSSNAVKWDIATNEADTSGALQFRPLGSGANAAYVTTSGNYVSVPQGTLWGSSNDGSGSGLDADTLDTVQLDDIVYGNYKGTFANVTMDANNVDRTGTYTSGAFTNRPSGTSWTYLDTKRLYSTDNNYNKQISYDTYNNNMWTRTESGGVWSDWYKIWNSYNHGIGSGLDADLLDGLHATSFVRAKDRTNWNASPSVGGNVVGQLGWKNYSNNHTIFDASAGTTPNGTSCSNADAGVAWTGSYPTLMGWNGAQTYGVRVDSARNADLLDGYNTSTSATANTVVVRQGAGNIYGNYILGSYFNASAGNSENPPIGQVWTQSTGDNYLRKSTPAHFRNQLGLWWTGNDGSGSGLDADSVDGIEGANIVRNDSGNQFMTGNHGTARLQLRRVDTSANMHSYLSMWASEPGITHDGCGIGGNIANAGYYYGVENTSVGTGSLMRFYQGNIEFKHLPAVAGAGNAGARTFYIDTGGNCTASGNISAYSDERLKTNIETIPSALEKVNALRGVTFDMNGVRGLGVIAQETETVIPEVVMTADDEMGTKSVAYGNMVGLLIEAIKELKSEVDDLRYQQEKFNDK
jgi:hypothetical protein